MHARELVELAALVAAHGPVLIRSSGEIPEGAIETYWTASKCRLDRWHRGLRRLAAEMADSAAGSRRLEGSRLRGVLEEILTGEVLTRVWTAATCAYDRHRGTDLLEPVARSVLIGHMEARHRVLALLVNGPGVDAEEAIQLDRLRRRTERWTDVLVGYLAGLHDISEFAVDPERARDFGEDLAWQSRQKGGGIVWPLVLSSLRASFRHGLSPVSPNADLNAKIAASILSFFPADVFDGTGVPQSLWLLRLTQTTSDAQGMIDALLRCDRKGVPGDGPGAARGILGPRYRRLGG